MNNTGQNIHLLYLLYPHWGRSRLLEPVPAVTGREVGSTQDSLRVFGLWEETRVHGDTPRMHRENIQTTHRKAEAEIQTPNRPAARSRC